MLPLTRIFAEYNAESIAKIHNGIPFQHWTPAEVVSEADTLRRYWGKWEISRVALSESGRVIGFCIGFELTPDRIYYESPGVYIHRLALEDQYRNCGIGAILHAETVAGAFARNLQYANRGPTLYVYEQTNDNPQNARMVQFYVDAGAKIVGRKEYANRVDLVLQITEQSFLASRHAEFRLAHKLD